MRKKKKTKKAKKSTRTITIKVQNGQLTYSGAGKKAHVHQGDDVVWKCTNGDLAGIFKDDETPLTAGGFYANAGQQTSPFPVDKGSRTSPYRYLVVVLRGGTVLMEDPEIIIDPS